MTLTKLKHWPGVLARLQPEALEQSSKNSHIGALNFPQSANALSMAPQTFQAPVTAPAYPPPTEGPRAPVEKLRNRFLSGDVSMQFKCNRH